MTEEFIKIITSNGKEMLRIKGAEFYFSIPRFIELLNKYLNEIGYDPHLVKERILLDVIDIKEEKGEEYPISVSLWELKEYCSGEPNEHMRNITNSEGVI